MLNLSDIILASQIISLMLLHQHTPVTASYVSFSNVYEAPTNGLSYAAPLPCDSPPLENYDVGGWDKPLFFASPYPLSYASVPHFKYAAAPVAPAALPDSFVKYSHGSEPRIKITNGAPVTTTYTTAVGFAAPPPITSGAPSLGILPPFAPAPATFAAPTSPYSPGLAYAAPPTFFSTSHYGGHTFLSAPPTSFKKFRTPSPVSTYAYVQGASHAVW